MIWKEQYALGVSLIDRQHKELFERVEAFMKALRAATPREDKVQLINETLEFMQGYVVEHFRDEEDYQRKIEYPGYAEHKRTHDEMVRFVSQVAQEYKSSGCNEQLIQQFGGKLLAWLINHVASDDRRIATYAIKKGVESDEN